MKSGGTGVKSGGTGVKSGGAGVKSGGAGVNDGKNGGKNGGGAQAIDDPGTGPPTTVSPIDVQFPDATLPASVWSTLLVPDTW